MGQAPASLVYSGSIITCKCLCSQSEPEPVYCKAVKSSALQYCRSLGWCASNRLVCLLVAASEFCLPAQILLIYNVLWIAKLFVYISCGSPNSPFSSLHCQCLILTIYLHFQCRQSPFLVLLLQKYAHFLACKNFLPFIRCVAGCFNIPQHFVWTAPTSSVLAVSHFSFKVAVDNHANPSFPNWYKPSYEGVGNTQETEGAEVWE